MKSREASQFGVDLQHVVANRSNLDKEEKADTVTAANQPGEDPVGESQVFLP